MVARELWGIVREGGRLLAGLGLEERERERERERAALSTGEALLPVTGEGEAVRHQSPTLESVQLVLVR